MRYQLQTDNMFVSEGVKARFRLNVPSNHFSGFTMSFAWDDENLNIIMTCVSASPDDSGVQYIGLGYGNGNQAQIIAAALQANYYFNRDFIISYGNGTVLLRARNYGTKYNITGFVHNQTNASPSTLDTFELGEEKIINSFFSLQYQIWKYVNEWQQIGIDKHGQPENNGILEIEVQDYLKSKKTGHFTFPVTTTLMFKHFGLVERYKLKYFEFYGDPPTEKKITESEELRCIHGSISYVKEQLYDQQLKTWYSDFVEKGKFLTIMPDEKITDTNMPEKLYWCAKKAYATLQLYFKVTFFDSYVSTINNHNLTGVSMYDIVELNVNLVKAGLNVIDTEKTIQKYEVYLAENDVQVSERRTFVVDNEYHEFARYFLFKSILGFYEAFRATGKEKKITEIKKTTGKQEQTSYENTDREEEQINEVTQNQYQLHTGNLLSRAENLYYSDQFMSSDDVYSLRAGQIFPVLILSSSNTVDDDQTKIYGFSFTYKLSVRDDSIFDLLETEPETGTSSFDLSFDSSFK
jgi:hypothetical protein